jgi:hypothetical protein
MPTADPPAPQGFAGMRAGMMDTADAAIRRERRPLPARDRDRTHYRRWAAAVLQAELKHATDDFWRAAHALGFGLLYDRYQRDGEAAPFRLPHEALAGTAALWLIRLQAHDSDRHGPWARWKIMTGAERIAWVRRRRALLHGFLRATRAYQAARCRSGSAEGRAREGR